MVKKKFSGQTIAIIILAVLLLITIAFGGVYAFYTAKSNKISGKIVMANLKISLVTETDKSDKSEIVISNGVNVVPGQPLENSPLVVRNLSSVSIRLVVVYELKAYAEDKTEIEDEHIDPVLGLGVEYVNGLHPEEGRNKNVKNEEWVDYVFNPGNGGRVYRCLVSMVDFAPTQSGDDGITVIAENKLSLSGAMGNDYQNASISFTFQAYAIGSATDFGIEEGESKLGICEKIVGAIYENQDEVFLNINVTR